MSEHYDGIPAGAVVEVLERHGINDWKRVGQGWLNLRVISSLVQTFRTYELEHSSLEAPYKSAPAIILWMKTIAQIDA